LINTDDYVYVLLPNDTPDHPHPTSLSHQWTHANLYCDPTQHDNCQQMPQVHYCLYSTINIEWFDQQTSNYHSIIRYGATYQLSGGGSLVGWINHPNKNIQHRLLTQADGNGNWLPDVTFLIAASNDNTKFIVLYPSDPRPTLSRPRKPLRLHVGNLAFDESSPEVDRVYYANENDGIIKSFSRGNDVVFETLDESLFSDEKHEYYVWSGVFPLGQNIDTHLDADTVLNEHSCRDDENNFITSIYTPNPAHQDNRKLHKCVSKCEYGQDNACMETNPPSQLPENTQSIEPCHCTITFCDDYDQRVIYLPSTLLKENKPHDSSTDMKVRHEEKFFNTPLSTNFFHRAFVDHHANLFRHDKILGYIVESKYIPDEDSTCTDAIHSRTYVPLEREDLLNTVARSKSECNNIQFGAAFSEPNPYDLRALGGQNVQALYYARISTPGKHIQVRIRTWTAHGISEASDWTDLLNVERDCAPCPQFSTSAPTQNGIEDCLCDAGYTPSHTGSIGNDNPHTCVPCTPGTYKPQAGNEVCTACNPTDNSLYTSDEPRVAVEDCVLVDPNLVSNEYPSFDFNARNVQPLVLCQNYKDAHFISTSRFDDSSGEVIPGRLIENQCVAIDVCNQQASSSQLLPNTWHHRSLANLKMQHEDALQSETSNYLHFNHYNIEYARIPSGVRLQTARPNFAHYYHEMTTNSQHSAVYWQPDPSTMRTFDGSAYGCDLTKDDKSNCVVNVQHDNLLDQVTSLGTTQMLLYSIEPGYACTHAGGDGKRIPESGPLPARLELCTETLDPHGTYDASCVLTCNINYEKINDKCEFKCRGFTHSCPQFHKATQTCTISEDGQQKTMYKCVECDFMEYLGSATIPWSPTYAETCERSQCADGSIVEDHLCVPCAEHHFANFHANRGIVNSCIKCDVFSLSFDLGAGENTNKQSVGNSPKHQPGRSNDGCLDCLFVDDITDSTLDTFTCDPGFYVETGFSAINQFIQTHATAIGMPSAFFEDTGQFYINPESTQFEHHEATMRGWCAAGFACLPCPPGTFQETQEIVKDGSAININVCTQCAVGAFQNNYAQQSCFKCADDDGTQTTESSGSTNSGQCLCRAGHQIQ